jgi:hypothetical protein
VGDVEVVQVLYRLQALLDYYPSFVFCEEVFNLQTLE